MPTRSRARKRRRLRASQIANANCPFRCPRHAGPVLLVEVDDDLGVGFRREDVPLLLERGAQLHVVEDLAVEDDPDAPVLVGDRLPAALEVDDAQPRVGEADVRIPVEAETVRAPVPEHGGHRLEVRLRARSRRGYGWWMPAMPHMVSAPS